MGLPAQAAASTTKGAKNADRAALHQGRTVPLRGHRVQAHRERDPQSRRLGGVPRRQRRSSQGLVAGRRRRAGAEILPQGGRARAAQEGRGRDRSLLAVALGSRRGGAGGAAGEGAQHRRAVVEAGVRAARRHLDLLGLEGRLFRFRGGRPHLLRRARLHAGDADGGTELAAMVQHRAALGLRHRRPEPGPFLRRLPDRQAGQVEVGLRASAAARLLHPVDQRRSRQRRRDHGSVGARGAPVQIRLGHRLELLAPARRRRASRRRRQVLRPDELPQDRRSRRRRHQVGRHHAARRQDGDRRHRSSRHRAVHRLEGARGAEGRRPRHRLQDQPEAPQADPQSLRELRGLGRRLLRSGEEPGPAARDQGRTPNPCAGQPDQARDPVRQAGL